MFSQKIECDGLSHLWLCKIQMQGCPWSCWLESMLNVQELVSASWRKMWSRYRISGPGLWLFSSSCKVPTVEFRECAPHWTLGEAKSLWWRAEIISLYVSSHPVFLPGILSCSASLHVASPPSKPWLKASLVVGVEGIHPSLRSCSSPSVSFLEYCSGLCGRASLLLPLCLMGKADNVHMKDKSSRDLQWEARWDLHPCWIIESFKWNLVNLGTSKLLVWVATEWGWPGGPGSSCASILIAGVFYLLPFS